LEIDRYIPGIGPNGADSVRINFVNPVLKQEGGFFYGANLALAFFQTKRDSLHIDLLGTFDDGKPSFVRSPLGQGWIYLSTTPLAFTNLNMLTGEGATYVFRALSYLSAENIWWDAYHKPLRMEARTPLRYILSAPALRMAYVLLVVGLLMFVFFHGKRKQRPIPVRSPEHNTTVEFTETVGRLYFHQGDHTGLALKMVEQFKHYLQTRLHLSSGWLTDVPPGIVASRTGVSLEMAQGLLADLGRVEQGESVDENGLLRLAARIDAFFKASAR
jgi:hypothetical protein